MHLSPDQVAQFHEAGWLLLPELFTDEEVALLRDEAMAIYPQDRPEIWREKSGAPRTAFAAHLYNEAFGLLGRHPRMIRPVEQIVRRAGLHAPVQDQRESRRSPATSGSGTRTTAPGRATTACRSRGR